MYHVDHLALLIKKIHILEAALDEIIHPVKYMEQQAKEEGSSLNGYAAILANDPSHLRSIARKALGNK